MNEKLEVVQTVLEYMIRLENGVKNTINYFQGGDEGEALKNLPLIFEGFEWVIDALTLTQSIQKEKIEFSDMIDKFYEINDGLENCDYILVSDLLEYEVLPLLSIWKEKTDKSLCN